jgi:hypothetical protein
MMAPNACGTLFNIKARMQNLGRTGTQAYYQLEQAISTLTQISKNQGGFSCSKSVV